MARCDVSQGSIEIIGNVFHCNEQHVPVSDSTIIISDTTTSNSVRISDSTAIVLFESVSLASPAPFTVENSNVVIILTGVNIIAGSSSGDAGVRCLGSSNITFQAISSGILKAIGSSYGPGIGSSANDTCDVLRFDNGSYDASAGVSGGAGIGSGFVQYGQSAVNANIFNDGFYNPFGSNGARIGSGYASSKGNAVVGQILLNNIFPTATISFDFSSRTSGRTSDDSHRGIEIRLSVDL
jgi:hypothetical protein